MKKNLSGFFSGKKQHSWEWECPPQKSRQSMQSADHRVSCHCSVRSPCSPPRPRALSNWMAKWGSQISRQMSEPPIRVGEEEEGEEEGEQGHDHAPAPTFHWTESEHCRQPASPHKKSFKKRFLFQLKKGKGNGEQLPNLPVSEVSFYLGSATRT